MRKPNLNLTLQLPKNIILIFGICTDRNYPSRAILRYIDEANIRQVLNRFFLESLIQDQEKTLQTIKSTLHQLFNARNEILHSGYKEGLTQAECQNYLDATERLLAI